MKNLYIYRHLCTTLIDKDSRCPRDGYGKIVKKDHCFYLELPESMRFGGDSNKFFVPLGKDDIVQPILRGEVKACVCFSILASRKDGVYQADNVRIKTYRESEGWLDEFPKTS